MAVTEGEERAEPHAEHHEETGRGKRRMSFNEQNPSVELDFKRPKVVDEGNMAAMRQLERTNEVMLIFYHARNALR